MTVIKAKLLGTPMIKKNGNQITFPYSKAEALFYYILIKKQVTRDILVNLLWGNIKEKSAKKNLRNAVYIIKKAFDEDILLSPQRTMIKLNTDINYEIDLESFMQCTAKESIDLYSGEFLEGFFVKKANEFEQWLFIMRNQCKDRYTNNLRKEIERCIQRNNLIQAEKHCKKLINAEEFDESSYRKLMDIYRRKNQHNKCIKTYNMLSKLLDRELSISPDVKTKSLLEEILSERSVKKAMNRNKDKTIYFCRKKELDFLKKKYYGLIKSNNTASVVVLGEVGAGKSTLLNKFINSVYKNEAHVFRTQCYQAEEKFLLKPWNDIFKQLFKVIKKEDADIPELLRKIVGYIFPSFNNEDTMEDINPINNVNLLKYQAAEKAIIEIFEIVSKNKSIILAIEDLQWIDDMSLTLLKNIILENRNQSIMVIATCRNGHNEEIGKFLTEMGMYELIEKLELERFNKEETIKFIENMMPDANISKDVQNLIYKESEGNALFISEFLNNLKEKGSFNNLSSKLQDILKSRYIYISEEGKKILNMTSIFFNKVDFETLKDISQKDELELIEIIDELINKYLLKEIVDSNNKIYYVFTHQKMREFIYSQLSHSKKRLLHNRIAKYLVSKLKNDNSDRYLYSKLIHHLEKSGNKRGVLKYKIKLLYNYLHLSNDVFPVINEEEMTKVTDYHLEKEEVFNEFNKIDDLFKQVRKENKNDLELDSLQLYFLHMTGRYNIRIGNYKKGLSIIKQMIVKALRLKNYSIAIKGYIEAIYYCINTYKVKYMETNIKQALNIAKAHGSKGEVAILMRLDGYQKVLKGDYNTGEKLLKKSVDIFNILDDKERYILNIAAAYNYIGESKRYNKKYKSALKYYRKAISICDKKGLISGLTVCNSNAGQASYMMNDYKKAEYYFDKALNFYKQFDFLWGRSIVNGYKAMLLVKQGKYDDSLNFIKIAENYVNRVKNPYEKGVICRIKAEIRDYMNKNDIKNSKINAYLKKSVKDYCTEVNTSTSGKDTSIEVEMLKRLEGVCNKYE